MEAKKPFLVLYHASCHDGFMSAAVCRRALGAEQTETRYVKYNEDPPYQFMEGRRVIYIVDFSYDPETLVKIARLAGCKVVVLDHHDTAVKKLTSPEAQAILSDAALELGEDAIEMVLDLDRSGAAICFDYFFGKTEVHPMVRHVSDRDLWRFVDPNTRDFMMRLMSMPYDFDVWDRLWDNLDPARLGADQFYVKFLTEGAAQNELFNQYIESHLRMGLKTIDLDGFRGVMLNCSPMFTSELGNRLVEDGQFDFALMYGIDHTRDRVVVGVRSLKEGKVHSGHLCEKHFHGGGHPGAAGGWISLVDLCHYLEIGETVKYVFPEKGPRPESLLSAKDFSEVIAEFLNDGLPAGEFEEKSGTVVTIRVDDQFALGQFLSESGQRVNLAVNGVVFYMDGKERKRQGCSMDFSVPRDGDGAFRPEWSIDAINKVLERSVVNGEVHFAVFTMHDERRDPLWNRPLVTLVVADKLIPEESYEQYLK